MSLPSLFAFAAQSEGASAVLPTAGERGFDSLLGLPPIGPGAAKSAGKTALSNPGFGATLPVLGYEADELSVIGAPSLRVFLEDGVTCIELRRQTRYMANLSAADLSSLRTVGEEVLKRLESMSKGPYSSRDLARMGHPYATGGPLATGNPTQRPPRSYRGRRIGAVKGVRGSVPSLTVVNSQSGEFARSWSFELRLESEGVRLLWKNDATSARGFPYSWALAGGTPRMRAHGPFSYAPLSLLGKINAAWSRVVYQGWQRAQMDAAAQRFLKVA